MNNHYKLKKSCSFISNFENVFNIRVLTILKYLAITCVVMGFFVALFGFFAGIKTLTNVFNLYLFVIFTLCAFYFVKFVAKLVYFLLIKCKLYNNLCYIPLTHESVVKIECDKDVLDYILFVRNLLTYEPHTWIDKFLFSDMIENGEIFKAPITDNHISSMIKFMEKEYGSTYQVKWNRCYSGYTPTKYLLYKKLRRFPFAKMYKDKKCLLDMLTSYY